MLFPGWLATIPTVPAPTIVTFVPTTVATLVSSELKLTANPLLAFALIPNAPSPYTFPLGNAPNVIVLSALNTTRLTVLVTGDT